MRILGFVQDMLSALNRFFFVREDDRKFKGLFDAIPGRVQNVEGRRILFDFTHIYYPKWNIKHSFIIKSKMDQGYSVDALYPSRLYFWFGIKHFIFSFIDRFSFKRKYLISAMGVSAVAGYPALTLRDLIQNFRDAKRFCRGVRSKHEVMNMRLKGVDVGDLVYDTYLKWFRQPTVEVKGWRFFFVILFAHCYASKVDSFLRSNEYDEIYLTHSVYIGYGFLARFALARGVSVYVTQNTRGTFIEKLSVRHPFQTPKYDEFKGISAGLKDSERVEGRALAKAIIDRRLSGSIDSSIYYMRSSGYSGVTEGVGICDAFIGRPRVVVFLHCFFDSPHIYRSMLFVDFYEWLDHVLAFCEKNRINVYVKEHPNAMPGNEAIVDDFRRRYNKAVFLKATTNNSLFFSAGFSLALTVYGTMAHEFAYKGLPVLNAGDNPHISYGFTITPSSIEEYDSAILDLLFKNKFSPDQDEVLDFFYVSNLISKWNALDVFDEKINGKGGLRDSYSMFLKGLTDEDLKEIFIGVSDLLAAC